MDKQTITKIAIYAGCLSLVFIVNILYFKSTKDILDKTIKAKFINTSNTKPNVTPQIQPALVTNSTMSITSNPLQVLKTEVNQKDITLDKTNMNLHETTTEMTGIKVLTEDEDLEEDVEDNSVDFKHKKSKMCLNFREKT